jgi:hypothetical protein
MKNPEISAALWHLEHGIYLHDRHLLLPESLDFLFALVMAN